MKQKILFAHFLILNSLIFSDLANAQITTSEITVEETNNATSVSGFLGIGTPTPQTRLHLFEAIGSGTQYMRLEGHGPDATVGLQFKSAATYMELTTYADKMGITGGNVGIGTTAPNYTLDVNGSLNANSLYNSGQIQWSDFVFNKDYNLPKLDQVEKYISKNGHLKNIPSEQEIRKKGYNLGDMDSKLLQKIEELTLYLIEQNKEIQELKEKVLHLENE